MKKLCIQMLRASAVAAVMLTISVRLMSAQSTRPEEMKHKVEKYLRNVFAFGPDVNMVVGDFKETGMPGLLETSIAVTIEGNKEEVKMWVSSDGKFLVRGELDDMSKDPLAETRAKLDLEDAPATGVANAPVTVVEFADFECPVCRNLHEALKELLPKYPQVRMVFKDFPLEQIHPWARTGALAGRCAYRAESKGVLESVRLPV